MTSTPKRSARLAAAVAAMALAACGEAADTGNLPVMTGFVIVAAAFVAVANIIADLVYALLDPRVRIA